MFFKIDTSAIEKHSKRLIEMSRSAFPIATRKTLNKAAFDTKQVTMPKEADIFIHRKPTFFKANSNVSMAQGFDIHSMVSEVGFVPKPNDTSHSVEDLEQQDSGGEIKGRAFVGLAKSRTNGWQSNVKTKWRLEKTRKSMVNPKDLNYIQKKRNFVNIGAKEQFVISAIFAYKNKNILLNTSHSAGLQVTNIKKVNGRLKVDYKKLYSVKKGRKIHPKATHFMERAALDSQKEMEKNFIKFADEALNKIP